MRRGARTILTAVLVLGGQTYLTGGHRAAADVCQVEESIFGGTSRAEPSSDATVLGTTSALSIVPRTTIARASPPKPRMCALEQEPPPTGWR